MRGCYRSCMLLTVLALAACGGGGSTTAVPAGQLKSNVVTTPLLPTADILRLRTSARPNVAASFPSLGTISHLDRTRSLHSLSTIAPGDVGFTVGDATDPASTATFAVMTAYTTAQYALPYPPSGKTTPPAKPVERFFGPEIAPGTSCLAAGILYANFGPGGTQRNGPGNPVETIVGPYNAFRVLDLCNAVTSPVPTFFLTPIDDAFVSAYVRSNERGLPSLVSEIFSPDPAGSTNARWFAVLYNFDEERWDVVMRSQGTTPIASPGEAVAYSGTRNLPQVCPNLPAIVARKIAIFDTATGRFHKADASNSQRVIPGIGIDPFSGKVSSNACFVADATGPASLSLSFSHPNDNSAWILRGTGATEPTDDTED